LAEEITKLKIDKNHKMLPYDIKDLYVNILIKETLPIAKSLLLKHSNAQETEQLITLLDIILQQNYFSFQNNMFQPEIGISMGSPIFSKIVEIFLQHLENIHLKKQLDTKTIVFYTRHVDDILLIYNTEHISPDKINEYINQIHPNLKLNPTRECNNNMSF
jgi:hypothetical protein